MTYIQYTPSVSTIILSGPTYSSQNVQQIWESTLSKSDYLVGHRGLGRTWEWIFKDFFFTFLEVNMSNILWSMRICKRTFFPVCRMCEYVNTLVYFTLHHIRARKGRQNHVWSFMTKYLRFLCKFTSWSGETPTGNFSHAFFLSWARIMSVLIGWPI
jgi:hypothetical protein